jgi:hypothetical protein
MLHQESRKDEMIRRDVGRNRKRTMVYGTETSRSNYVFESRGHPAGFTGKLSYWGS